MWVAQAREHWRRRAADTGHVEGKRCSTRARAFVVRCKHRMPFGIEAKFNIVDLADLAEAVVNVSTMDGHEFATYQLAGPQALNQIEMARIISEETGKPIVAEPKHVDEFASAAKKNGMPPDRIEQLCIMNEHYNKHGLKGNSNVLEWILGRPATTFATYIKNNLV